MKYFHSWILIACIMFFTTSCQKSTEPTVMLRVTDEASPLIGIVNCSKNIKLPDQWSLSVIETSQGSDLNGDQFGACYYSGSYLSRNRDNKLFEINYRVVFPTNRVIDEKSVFDESILDGEDVHLELINISKDQYVSCKKDQEMIVCNVASQSNKVIIFFRLWVDGDVGNSTLEEIINPVLNKLRISIADLKTNP